MAKMPKCRSRPYHIGFVGHSLSWSLGVTVILLFCIAQQGLGSIHACVFFFFFLFILIINNNRLFWCLSGPRPLFKAVSSYCLADCPPRNSGRQKFRPEMSTDKDWKMTGISTKKTRIPVTLLSGPVRPESGRTTWGSVKTSNILSYYIYIY